MEPLNDDMAQEETRSKIPVIQQLGILMIILLLIFGTSLIPEQSDRTETTTEQNQALVTTGIDDQEKNQPFESVLIAAQSAFVWDVQAQRVLYQKNPDDQLPLASLTKLMTAMVAHELVKEQKEVVVDTVSLEQYGDSGLLDGESFSLKNLLDLTLLASSNDGAYALAAAAGAVLNSDKPANTFVKAMNIRAEELGLKQTYFRNPTGLDISDTEGGAYGSARDVTFLMEHILTEYPEILAQTQLQFAYVTNEQGAVHNIENTNPTVDQIAGLIGSKTGYTDLAGGNLAIAFDAAFNRPVIVVVLDSTYYGRFEDVVELSQRARQAITD